MHLHVRKISQIEKKLHLMKIKNFKIIEKLKNKKIKLKVKPWRTNFEKVLNNKMIISEILNYNW